MAQFLIQIFLALFWGLMSGLCLGMSTISHFDIKVLAKFGTPKDKLNAAKILPVVSWSPNLLFVTFAICDIAAQEALPVFSGGQVTKWVVFIISATFVLLSGEIIPRSFTKHGLDVAALVSPFVRILLCVCFPVAYPYSKLLDCFHGHALFRCAELKAYVYLHWNEAGNGSELTHDETTTVARALKLAGKTARDAMTPISETFAIDLNARLDRSLTNLILEKGHSKVPVYCEKPTNIIGLFRGKDLINVDPDDEETVRGSVSIFRIPKFPETLPLHDILKKFQKSPNHNHMAIVVRQCPKTSYTCAYTSYLRGMFPCLRDVNYLPMLPDEEAVGIITMEDVIKEVLQEEEIDETDHHGRKAVF